MTGADNLSDLAELRDGLEMAGLPHDIPPAGFDSPNHTQTPNDLFDRLMADMGVAELKVILAAVRLTYGYHRQRCRMSLTGMQALTGLSRQGVLDGAAAAEKRGILARKQSGRVTEWIIYGTSQASGLVKPVDRTSQASRPPSIKESSKEKSIGAKSARPARKPKLPDELFDAIAEVCQSDPNTAGGSIGKVAGVLRKAEPPYTPAEVRAFGKHWWGWADRKTPPTIWQLQERIGQVRVTASRPVENNGSFRMPEGV